MNVGVKYDLNTNRTNIFMGGLYVKFSEDRFLKFLGIGANIKFL